MALIAAGRRDAAPAIGAPCPLPTGANPYTPNHRGSRGNSPTRGPRLFLAARCAAAEGGSPAYGAFAAAIELSARGEAPEWIQLFPKGPELKTVSYDERSWRLSDPAAVAAASTQDGLDLPIDWEHAQAIKAPKGERVETAGWIKAIAVRDGVLTGRVEWTAAGRESVESREYRYFSPYFLAAKATGEVWRIQHGGLVKTPAFTMPALASAGGRQGQEREETMLKKILELLGLAADATEEQAAAAIATLQSGLEQAKAAAEAPSLEKFVPRADYEAALARASAAEGKLAEQAASALDEEIKRELDAAQEAGKITPASRAYHEAQCKTEGGLERFKQFAAAAREIAGASGLSGSPPSGGASGSASAAERAVARAFGHTVEFAREHGSASPAGGSD